MLPGAGCEWQFFEQQRLVRELCAFDREQPEFCLYAAAAGITARLAVCGEHTMAWDDQGNRIFPERLAHVAGRLGFLAELRGDFAVVMTAPRGMAEVIL